jgi:hypothetical protein
MNKKYQIFVSSTFEDLRREREAVAKTILEVGDIPVGMEMFSAADEEQWALIKRQIEQSDYYVIIVAHRYGSMVGDVSFTEREYDYAVKIGVPVLGFVIEDSAVWPANHLDKDPILRTKLEAFKAKIRSRMVSFWATSDSLAGKVLAALGKQKNLTPRPGWIRAENIPGPEVLAEVTTLSREVARLAEENSNLKQKASLEAQFSLIDSMSDDPDCQAVILMFETGKDIPPHTPYAYSYDHGGAGSGSLATSTRERLVNAGVIRLTPNRGWRLSDEGKRFAEWLINKGRRCDIFWTPVGGWGDPDPETERGRSFLGMKQASADWYSKPSQRVKSPAGEKHNAPGNASADTDQQAAVREAIRRDQELSSGAVAGRTQEEVIQAARRAIGCD